MIQEKFNFEQHLRFCFWPPCPPAELPAELHNPELRPMVHMLRRDLELLYGLEGEEYCPGGPKPGFIILLTILCGFDMLACMYSGEEPLDEPHRKAKVLLKAHDLPEVQVHQSGKKYRKFLTEIGDLDEHDAAYLCMLRNSFVHTYSLNLRKKAYRNNKVTNGRPTGKLLEINDNVEPKEYVLNLWELKRTFLRAIGNFKKVLESPSVSAEVKRSFEEHISQAGYIVTTTTKA